MPGPSLFALSVFLTGLRVCQPLLHNHVVNSTGFDTSQHGGSTEQILVQPSAIADVNLAGRVHRDSPARRNYSHRAPDLQLQLYTLFQALSYTWGDPRCSYLDSGRETDYLEAKHAIECGGQRFIVRRNLLDALKMLSTHPDIISPFVWIDAICIDQNNLQERSS